MAATSEKIQMSFQKTAIGQLRSSELEDEVARLHKLLQDEERVHEILERVLLLNGIPSVLHIPSFLPKKAKELFAELIMLEEEIARLEGEISKIQQSVSITEETQAQDKYNKSKHKITSLITSSHLTSPIQVPMFFINQAIKGAYSPHGFASNGNSLETTSKMEKQRVMINQEKIPWKRGKVQQHPSPKKPPMYPFPKESDSNAEWQPNKLSEKIMKCLLCIFLRLMRTSRSMELENSRNVSRSNYSLSRTKGLYLNSSINIQREARQKDPYGIFDIEDSMIRDVGPYKKLVRFSLSSLELKGASSCLPMLNNLRELVSKLHDVNLKPLNHQQKLAFWINAHNICIMHGFLVHGLPSNPEKVFRLRNKAELNIGGMKLNAMAIEHFILRKTSNTNEACLKDGKDSNEDTIRIHYGLKHPEPNVQFALCFGNRSSPAVKIYTAEGVSAELESSKLEYLRASIVITSSRRIMIPELLSSNMYDVAANLGNLVEWICNQLPTSETLRKSITECVRCLSNGKISEIVDILPQQFDFQYLLPM